MNSLDTFLLLFIIIVFIKEYEKANKKNKRNKNKKTFAQKTDKYFQTKKTKTSYQEKQIKGKEFEKYVARYYQLLDYTVIEHGQIMGRKDKGIDIIAENEKEILLIQCKNYDINSTWKIRQKDIKAFRMDCLDFIHENPKYKIDKTKALFIISDNFIDNGAKNYIKEKKAQGKKIDYKIISY